MAIMAITTSSSIKVKARLTGCCLIAKWLDVSLLGGFTPAPFGDLMHNSTGRRYDNPTF
jgi:hypothetical protein